jgi:hypothetical protein
MFVFRPFFPGNQDAPGHVGRISHVGFERRGSQSCVMSARRIAFPFFTLQLGRYFFGQKFPRKWFGRGVLILLSPFNPVLTPLDFFFRGIKGGMLEAFTLNPTLIQAIYGVE